MGRGNYCPKGEVTDQWYIDHDLYLWDDDEHDEDEVDYDLMLDDIDTLMISIRHRFPSFHKIKEWGDNYWGEKYLLENSYFRIGIADNQWSEAVFIQMKDDLWPELENLAIRHFDEYRKGIARLMLDMFGTIYLRSGPWTSSRVSLEAG